MGILIERGWLGLLAFLAPTPAKLFSAWRLAAFGNSLAMGVLAMAIGILIPGLFSTILDVPRVAFVLYMLMMMTTTLLSEDSGGRGGSARQWD